MDVVVVVPVINNHRGCIELLESIKTRHQWWPIIVPQWRERKPLAWAWNQSRQGFEIGAQYALVVNDDVLLAPYALDAMIEHLQRTKELEGVILTSAHNLNPAHNDEILIDDPWNILKYPIPPKEKWSEWDNPNFSAFLIDRDFFAEIGSFDENFIPAWFEDNDIHYRCQLLGWRAVCTNAAPCIHWGGASTALLDVADSSRSKAYYLEKWGGLPPGHGGKEQFLYPYNVTNLSPRKWIRNYPLANYPEPW